MKVDELLLFSGFSYPLASFFPDPDIDPSWYTGRGIRPVGRFGRRRAAGKHDQKSGNKHRPDCLPALEERNESLQDE